MNDRVSFDLALYKRKTINEILRVDVAPSTGYNQAIINAGELDNKGIEVELTGKPLLSENVVWNTGFNFAADHSFVKALPPLHSNILLGTSRSGTATVNAMVGHQYDVIMGYKFKRDKNGDIINLNGLPERADSKTVLGRATPSWTAGWINTIHVKNWSLNFLVDVNWGGQIFSNTNVLSYEHGLNKATLVGRAKCDQMKKMVYISLVMQAPELPKR